MANNAALPPELQNSKLGPKEKAKLYIFKVEDQRWDCETVKVQIADKPFAEGGIRGAYHGIIHFDPKNDPKKTRKFSFLHVVVKIAKNEQQKETYFVDVSMQMYARWWAKKFNDTNPPKKVHFVEAFALKMKERKGHPIYGAELFIRGLYIKYSDNFGFVNKDHPRNTPYAFSHWTYQNSSGRQMIVDIQGVDDYYTDPQIHSLDEKGFGIGNLGEVGFKKFFETHQCNAVCAYLGLNPINPKKDDKGTWGREQVQRMVQQQQFIQQQQLFIQQQTHFQPSIYRAPAMKPVTNVQTNGLAQQMHGLAIDTNKSRSVRESFQDDDDDDFVQTQKKSEEQNQVSPSQAIKNQQVTMSPTAKPPVAQSPGVPYQAQGPRAPQAPVYADFSKYAPQQTVQYVQAPQSPVQMVYYQYPNQQYYYPNQVVYQQQPFQPQFQQPINQIPQQQVVQVAPQQVAQSPQVAPQQQVNQASQSPQQQVAKEEVNSKPETIPKIPPPVPGKPEKLKGKPIKK